MSGSFGYELEAHIPNLEKLAQYLLVFGDSQKTNFGVDGAGISTIEYRSPVFSSLLELEKDLENTISVLKVFSPDFRSYIGFSIDPRESLTHSLHLSLGVDMKVDMLRLYLCFYLLYPLWLFFKSPSSSVRWHLRKFLYPEMFRAHKNRLETRFLSSEFPIESLWVIRYIVKE